MRATEALIADTLTTISARFELAQVTSLWKFNRAVRFSKILKSTNNARLYGALQMIFFHWVHALLVYECPEQLCITTALSFMVLGNKP